MKKIYLEKQFMKATNSKNYIIGEIVAHSKESGEYQIKREDGTILTVFSHSILGWEEYKEERPYRAFNVDKLNKLVQYYTSPLEGQRVKTIYTIDACRQKDGSNIFGFAVSNVKENGTIVITTSGILRGTFEGVAETILESVNKDVELGREAELRVNVLGLGVGLIDYLDECPIPVKMYYNDDIKASYFSLIKKVEKEELIINTKLKEVLENLDNQIYMDGKGCLPFLRLHEQNDEQCALLGSLLLTCHEGGKFLCQHKFELWIEKGFRICLTGEVNTEVETYYLKIKDNETGEEQPLFSSQHCYEMENIMRHMTQAFDLSGTKVKVHTKIKE